MFSRVARIFEKGGGHKLVQLGGTYTQIFISIYIQILQEGARAPGAPSGYALDVSDPKRRVDHT